MAVREAAVPLVKAEIKESLWTRIKRSRLAYAFIAPALTAMLLVHIIPTLQALYMSLLDLDAETLLRYLGAPFVGLQHYQHIIGGLIFGGKDTLIKGLYQALINSAWFMGSVLVGSLGIGLVLALLLNREFIGRNLARTLVLLPWVVPTFVVGIIFQFIWHQDGGLANRVLFDWLHLTSKPITWLIGPNARWALIIPAIWSGLPFTTVTLLATLQMIPIELYEAAVMDGAGTWNKFRGITLPFLFPIISINVILITIFNFFGFGPYNIAVSLFSTDNLGTYVNLLLIAIVRQTFNNQLYGYGAAASTLMMLLTMVVVAIWYYLTRGRMSLE